MGPLSDRFAMLDDIDAIRASMNRELDALQSGFLDNRSDSCEPGGYGPGGRRPTASNSSSGRGAIEPVTVPPLDGVVVPLMWMGYF